MYRNILASTYNLFEKKIHWSENLKNCSLAINDTMMVQKTMLSLQIISSWSKNHFGYLMVPLEWFALNTAALAAAVARLPDAGLLCSESISIRYCLMISFVISFCSSCRVRSRTRSMLAELCLQFDFCIRVLINIRTHVTHCLIQFERFKSHRKNNLSTPKRFGRGQNWESELAWARMTLKHFIFHSSKMILLVDARN